MADRRSGSSNPYSFRGARRPGRQNSGGGTAVQVQAGAARATELPTTARGSYEAFADALVMPLSAGTPRRGGVFARGRIVPESLLQRNRAGGGRPGPVIGAAHPAPPQATSDETVIFAGYLLGHFGHFLLESLSRLWAVRSFPDVPIAWSGPRSHYATWQSEILDLLGVTNPPLFVAVPTRFASVVVPEQGFVVPRTFHDWHAEFLGVVEPDPVVPGRRAWLSRAALPDHRHHVAYEPELERSLASEGWEIFQPEAFTVGEQLSFLSSCERISGFDGSAFHTPMLLTRLESVLEIFTARGANQNLETIAERKGFRQRLVDLESARFLAGTSHRTEHRVVSNLSAIREVLGIPVTPLDPASMTPGDAFERVVRAAAPSSYLELGTTSPGPLLAIDAPAKTAVSASFPFDIRNFSERDVTFFQVDPPVYFTRFAGEERFDLVSVRSAASLEELLRWFGASLPFSSPRTLWTIEAPDSSELATAHPADGEPLRDPYLFKFALVLAEFFPTFDYRTIETPAGLQILVWQEPQNARVPGGETLASIAAADHQEYLWRREELRIVSLDEAVAAVSTLIAR